MLRKLLLINILFLSGCYSPQTAMQAAAYSNPQAKAWKSWGGGGVELGTNFSGHAIMEFAPDGRVTKLDVTIDSKPQDVIKAEGERITEQFNQLMAANYAAAIQIQQARTEGLIRTTEHIMTGVSNIAGLMLASGAPPEKAQGFIESITPALTEIIKNSLPKVIEGITPGVTP
jgi:hypothetical protein